MCRRILRLPPLGSACGVNQSIKTVFELGPGKGLIKKSHLRRELESNVVAEIYTRED